MHKGRFRGRRAEERFKPHVCTKRRSKGHAECTLCNGTGEVLKPTPTQQYIIDMRKGHGTLV